ncbi:MAG: hypothetical protein EOO43_22690 [Flavobacterium sp.]|nr:MAG: hypothetical protein EOO43_22690 [Flavobacterium sp.]
MDALEKIETYKWLLDDESSLTYYKRAKDNDYYSKGKKAYKNGEMNDRFDEGMKPIIDMIVEVDVEKEHKQQMRGEEVIKRPAKVLFKYKDKIEAEFGISIDIVDFWEKYYGDISTPEPEMMKEENIIKQIIKHAVEEREKFNKIANEVKETFSSTQQFENQTIINKMASFEHLFGDSNKFNFTLKALQHFSIISKNGNFLLQGRYEGKIAGFIDALVVYHILPNKPDKFLHDLFCKMLNLETKRLKRHSKQHSEMKEAVERYCKSTYKSL